MTMTPPDRAQFMWNNCYGDVVATRYNVTIRDYWDKIASPALAAAEEEVERWKKNDDESAVFVVSIVEDDLAITASAFCLSLQSIWERQLRTYLVACARTTDQHTASITSINHAHWHLLQEIFERVRGVPMTLFTSYQNLDLLSKLGNVCRHGDGRTADALWRSHPMLWPYYCTSSTTEVPIPLSAPSADMIQITRQLLVEFVAAIEGFWVMINYLYHESLQSKVPRLEKQLETERKTLSRDIAFFNSQLALRGEVKI